MRRQLVILKVLAAEEPQISPTPHIFGTYRVKIVGFHLVRLAILDGIYFITSYPARLPIQLPHDAQTFVLFHSSRANDLFDLKAMRHIFSASEANSCCSHVYNINRYHRFD